MQDIKSVKQEFRQKYRISKRKWRRSGEIMHILLMRRSGERTFKEFCSIHIDEDIDETSLTGFKRAPWFEFYIYATKHLQKKSYDIEGVEVRPVDNVIKIEFSSFEHVMRFSNQINKFTKPQGRPRIDKWNNKYTIVDVIDIDWEKAYPLYMNDAQKHVNRLGRCRVDLQKLPMQ